MVFSLTQALYVLGAAVVLGVGLAIHYLRGLASRPAWPLRFAHAVFGAAGLAVALAALRRGSPPSAMGTAGFAAAAAVLLGLALLFGVGIVLLRRRPPGVLIAIHAGLAVAGFVVLWTLVSLG